MGVRHMGKEGTHSGHGKRVRMEFFENGFSPNTPTHKIVEMMLYYAVPRKDTNNTAHALVERFGTISGILDASKDELIKVPGVGECTAAFLKMIIPIARIYLAEKSDDSEKRMGRDDVCRFLMSRYFGLTDEVFSMVTFNGKGNMISYDILARGNANEVHVSARDIIENALKRKAACTVIAHNHPGGVAIPSEEDIFVTDDIKAALDHIGVKLLDHVIITDDDYVCMAISKDYKGIFE